MGGFKVESIDIGSSLYSLIRNFFGNNNFFGQGMMISGQFLGGIGKPGATGVWSGQLPQAGVWPGQYPALSVQQILTRFQEPLVQL